MQITVDARLKLDVDEEVWQEELKNTGCTESALLEAMQDVIKEDMEEWINDTYPDKLTDISVDVTMDTPTGHE